MPHATVHEEITLTLEDVHIKEIRPQYYRVKFITDHGSNEGILHHREGCTAGTIMVGGTGGGWDGPASIYRDMGPDLLKENIATLRLDFRRRAQLEDCVLDVLVGIEYLKELGINRVGLVGWSFGGAVVISTGVISDAVKCVATIASQSYGADEVDDLSPKAILLLHGTGDRTLPPSSSQFIYDKAREPKELVFYPHANHGIDQNRDDVKRRIEEFLIRYLEGHG